MLANWSMLDVMLVALVIYLGFRLVQGIIWVAHKL